MLAVNHNVGSKTVLIRFSDHQTVHLPSSLVVIIRLSEISLATRGWCFVMLPSSKLSIFDLCSLNNKTLSEYLPNQLTDGHVSLPFTEQLLTLCSSIWVKGIITDAYAPSADWNLLKKVNQQNGLTIPLKINWNYKMLRNQICIYIPLKRKFYNYT